MAFSEFTSIEGFLGMQRIENYFFSPASFDSLLVFSDLWPGAKGLHEF